MYIYPFKNVLIFTKIRDLKAFIASQKAQGKSIGFVPTMGALHQGHLELVKTCLSQANIAVCSVFVNPTQFNDPKDLERYPRTPEKDADMLKTVGTHVLFLPTVEEMYPEPDKRQFDFGQLDKVLDGAHRPGHFNGVAQIVSKLFDAVEPNLAFFGRKDLQQLLIIRKLVALSGYPIKIIACDIVREPDGLAMSSRNALLNAEERKAASIIPQLMFEAKRMKDEGKNVKVIIEHAKGRLSSNKLYRLDYFEICNEENLLPISSFEESKQPVALIACFVGKIRLIDNISL
jgi:pantoate--beta-alanine ligase